MANGMHEGLAVALAGASRCHRRRPAPAPRPAAATPVHDAYPRPPPGAPGAAPAAAAAMPHVGVSAANCRGAWRSEPPATAPAAAPVGGWREGSGRIAHFSGRWWRLVVGAPTPKEPRCNT